MNLFKQFLEYARYIFSLTSRIEQSQSEVKQLRQEVERLTDMVQNLAYDVRYSLNDEKHEREKIMLKVENELLRFERRLPSPKDSNSE